MMPAHPTDLLEAYTLHLLSPASEADVAAHLDVCRSCQAEVASLATTLGMLAYAAPTKAPSAQVEERLFARIAALRDQDHQQVAAMPNDSAAPSLSDTRVQPDNVMPLHPVSRTMGRQQVKRPAWQWAALSAVAALLAVLLVAVSLTQHKTTTAPSPTKLAEQALHVPHPQTFTLKATQHGPQAATGAMAMDPSQQRGVLVVIHLPPPPAGKTYEFWLVQSAGANAPANIMPSGTFGVHSDGSSTFFFTTTQPLSTLVNAGVSLERAGGVPVPDAPMLLLIND